VVADYFTVRLLESFHKVAADRGEAAQLALEAGLDVELPTLDAYGAPLRERIERGMADVALVDRSVRRVLAQKFALGLFEHPRVEPARASRAYEGEAPVRLARELAERSMVLLRNEGGLLPLSPELRAIAVIGPAADDPRLLQGDYSYPAHVEIVYKRGGAAGAGDITPASGESAMAPGPYYRPMVTPLAGIRAALGDPARVRHARGCDVSGEDASGIAAAAALAAGCDVAVVCVGGKSGLLPDCTSGEFRDAASLALTGVQPQLVEAVVATGTPTVVVLLNGRPLALPWIAEHVPAVLEAWLPGEQGGAALADVLFGRANPAGRLPVTIPRSVGQVPIYHDHKSGGGRSQMLGDYSDLPASPLFPFGHGLSYTEFAYGALTVEPAIVAPDGEVAISLDVTNTGERAGDEVVQLYLHDPVASVTRPALQLAGFVRARFEPGQTRRVTFTLDPSQLAFHRPDMRFAIEPGEIEVRVGASSADLRAEGRFRIEGAVREIPLPEVLPTRVDVR
jgi:beta-glucosidase